MMLKLEPVTILDKRNTGTSKKFDDDVISANCDAIVIFSIGTWSIKLIFSLIVAFYLTKTEDRRHSSNIIALSKDTIFAKKC